MIYMYKSNRHLYFVADENEALKKGGFLMIAPKTKTRITFDFTFNIEGERRKSYENLAQIICASHWGTGIDIFGFLNENESLLFDFINKAVIVIDECAYKLQEPPADSETARKIKSMLGKRSGHPVLRDMAALFGGEPFEASKRYRNTIYLPNLKAFARADGMKPEDVAEMLALDECDRIILFPYFPLDGKSAYYELTLGVSKESFVDFMNQYEQRQADKIYEALTRADERGKAGCKATLRAEKKSDWKAVEQVTYRAFRDAPPTGADDDGMEALLAHKLRSCAAFVPELDYVAELNGSVIGNIMYTRSKVTGADGGEWDTLTFGPVSVLPKYQRDGVGSALIRETLEAARELGYRAVLIFGHERYYPRFGFKPASEFGITTADGKNFPAFMALPLYDSALDGVRGRLILDEVYFMLDKAESGVLDAKLAEPMDIDEYINAQSFSVQPILRRVRGTIRNAAPEAVEKISWQMPTFRQGQNLIHFAAQKKHIGIYPGAEAMEYFTPRLSKYKTSKGAIQFPYKDFGGEQLRLITEIASWCAEHNAK
jgi:predicted N-acetyltransferase YhbS/uncharacterized protein YdhG (YjbR/CyaY superfamily)